MKTQINITSMARRSLLLASVTTLILVQSAFAQTPARPPDARLDTKVTYTTTQASVQDIVQNLAQQAGLKYDWQKSHDQTDPICRQWVRNVSIDGKSCREALDQILKPVGLRYEVDNGTIVLSRVLAASPANEGAEPPKLEAARKALTGAKKDPARAQKLLLELVGRDRATLQPDSLSYAYVYLGYIEDRAGNRQKALAWYKQALEIPNGDSGIQACAELGLKQPLTWIRHLDPDTPPPQSAPSTKPPQPAKTL